MLSKSTPGNCICHALLQGQGPNQLAVSCQRPLRCSGGASPTRKSFVADYQQRFASAPGGHCSRMQHAACRYGMCMYTVHRGKDWVGHQASTARLQNSCICAQKPTSGQDCVVQAKQAHCRQFNQARHKTGVACMDYLGPSMQPWVDLVHTKTSTALN